MTKVSKLFWQFNRITWGQIISSTRIKNQTVENSYKSDHDIPQYLFHTIFKGQPKSGRKKKWQQKNNLWLFPITTFHLAYQYHCEVFLVRRQKWLFIQFRKKLPSALCYCDYYLFISEKPQNKLRSFFLIHSHWMSLIRMSL